MTVLQFVRLAERQLLQRPDVPSRRPNFVIQGGSPDADDGTRWHPGCRPESRSWARLGGTSSRCITALGQADELEHGHRRFESNQSQVEDADIADGEACARGGQPLQVSEIQDSVAFRTCAAGRRTGGGGGAPSLVSAVVMAVRTSSELA